MEQQEFNGIIFYQTSPNDYFRHSVGHTTILMHKYVWEFYNGKIPKGYEVHHIDRNRANNKIENLQLLTRAEHRRLHASLLTEEEREWKRNNIITKAVPKAKEWHSSEEGRQWHKEHYAKCYDILHRQIEKVCQYCGEIYVGESKSKFCSNKCKSAYRRKSGKDLVERTCVVCGKSFMTDKNGKVRCCSMSCRAKYGHQNRQKS